MHPDDASTWLRQGKILIHSTEGIWGLGCDPKNKDAIKKIFFLKKRDPKKNFILLSATKSQALKYFAPISIIQDQFLESIWPGHTTVVYSASSLIPKHITLSGDSIAIRVSNHLPVMNLLKAFNSLMVSTSANISNEPTPADPTTVMEIFRDQDVAMYAHPNGSAAKPSAIIDLKTMDYIRE